MKCLVYSSKSKMAQISLADILLTSRVNNRKFGITGFLVAHSRGFIQLIEGEEAVIDQLYRNINDDQRHCDVKTIAVTTIQERRFPDWDMGYTYLPSNHQLLKDYLLNKQDQQSLIDIFTRFIRSDVTLLSRSG